MPSSKNGGNIKFGVDFEANQASLNKLKKSLQDLQKIKFGGDFNGNRQEFNEVKSRITEIQTLMKNAFNPTLNTSNITAFKNELDKSGLTLKQIQSDLSRFGTAGNTAFNQLTTSVLTTNLKLKQTNSLVDSMGKTMVNTVKWGVASSVMNTFTQSVQGAFQYVQSLERSLTNIRIVTGDSTEKMAQFAEQANKSAQALGRSTLDYTKASLTYYQQGLSDQDVQARTEATLKAQNITRAGDEMADYLTAVWNGYKVANEEAEIYVDKLAAVADSSASDMSQLAIAMSKVASTANTMGVDIDQLNAQIATVVATTRQAPESVGTAFKTIYSRMNDIKTGSDEAEISLGNYSGKMAELGFNVLDATGHLRDTGQVMEEIGGRWQELTKEQQVYLAQTMGGQRQVNQLMALFDNWTTYSELLNTSLESEGTLAEKNARYMESLGAKMEQLGAAGERVKAALIDSDSMKGLIEALTSVTNLAANLFETMGSGQTILLAFGSTITQLFSGTIAKEINNIITNMQNVKSNAEAIQKQIELTKMVQQVGKDTPGGTFAADRMSEIQQYYSVMNQASINNQKNLIRERAQLQNNIQTIDQERDAVQKIAEKLNNNKEALDWSDVNTEGFRKIEEALGNITTSLADVRELSAKDLFEGIFDKNGTAQSTFVTAFNKFIEDYKQIDTTKAEELSQLFDKFTSGQMSGGAFFNKLNVALDEAEQKSDKLSNTIYKSGQALSDASNKARVLDRAIQEGADSAKQLFDVTNAVKMVSAIGQISSSLMTISNLGSIWKDEDVSAGEKILKTITTIGFVIPSFVTAAKNLKISTFDAVKAQGIRLTTLKLQTKEKEKQLAFDKLMKLQSDPSSTLAQRQAAEAAFQSLNQQVNILKNEGASSLSVLETGLTSLLGPLTSILPILLGIGAVVGVGYLLYKDFNQASEAAQKAAKTAQQAKENYDNLKESFKNLTSAIADYKDAQTALSELTTGTEEWYDAVNDLNDKVLELISNFPQLAKYLERSEDGILSISEEGFKEVENQARQKAYAAGLANANAQQDAYEAQRKSDIVNESRRIYSGWDNSKALEQAMDVMKNQSFSGEDELRQALSKTDLTDSQIDATIENSEAIYKLIGSLDAQQAKVDALKDTYTRSILQNEESYKNSTNKQALASMVTAAVNETSSKLNQKYYNVDAETGQKQLNTGLLFNRYSELTGEKIRGTGFLGLQKERQLEDGTWQKISSDFAANQVATLEAMEDFDSTVESISARLAEAEKDFAEVDDRTKQLLFDSGLAGGFDKINTKTLTENDIDKLKGLNQQDLADYLNIDVSEVSGKLEELRNEIQTGLDDFINGIDEQNTRDAMLQLKDAYGSDLSRELAETIAQNIQDGYQKAGDKGGDSIRDFYKKLSGDQAEELANLTEEYNFAGGSAEDFKNAIREIGITSDEISDSMVKSFYEAQRQIQQITSKQARVDPGKVAEGSSTLNLIEKQSNGDKLSTKETQALESGISNLLTLYPELTKEIQVLNETGMVGTGAYEESLRKLKLAFVSSYQEMLAAGTITLDQVTSQMSNYIKTSEDLQMVQNAGLISEENYQQKLKLIANEYESCKGELEQYITALQVGNQKAQEAAQFSLQLALRSAQSGEKYGIEAERVSDLAKQYAELGRQGNEAYQGLQNNAELAVDAAIKNIRLNDSIENLQKNFTSVSEVLDTLSTHGIEEILADADYAKTFEQIKENVAGILDVSQELVDADFIKKYSQQIKEAANGSQEAVDALQDAFAEDIIANIEINDQDFYNTLGQTKEQFAEWINGLPQGEINLDENPAIQSLVTLLEQAGYSKEQIEDLFNAADIHLDLGYPDMSGLEEAAQDAGQYGNEIGEGISDGIAETAGVDVVQHTEKSQQTDNMETAGFTTTLDEVSKNVLIPRIAAASIPGVGVLPIADGTDSFPMTYYGVTQTPNIQKQDVSKTNTAVGLEVKGATKSSGGKVSHKNRSAGNKGGGGGGKHGGGGGGGGSKPKQAKKMDAVKGKPDRYRNNTVRAGKLADKMQTLSKQQSRLTGKDVTDNLKKQLDILEKQKGVIEEKLNLQRDQQNELQQSLKKYGANFGKDGTLTNYTKVFHNIKDAYNKEIAWYNTLTGEEQEEESVKARMDAAKKQYDEAKKNFERYDTLTEQEMKKTVQDRMDKIQEIIDKQVQTFKIKIDATIDLGQARRQYEDFVRDVVKQIRDDDFIGQNQYEFRKLASYMNSNNTGTIQSLSTTLDDILKNRNGIFSSRDGKTVITDSAQQMEQLKKYLGEMQKELGSFKEGIAAIKQSIFDGIDQTQAAFDEQMAEYEYIGDLIDHNVKVIKLMYGDDAYQQMANYYDKIENNNNKQLDFLRRQKDMWYGMMMEEEKRMQKEAAAGGTDSNLYKEARDRFQAYKRRWMDSVNDLNAKVEDSIENIIDKYTNQINLIFRQLELKWTNGLGFDTVQEEWEQINDLADMYLDKINSMYELEKLQGAYQDAIDSNKDNVAAQQSLNDMMKEQLAYLKDKDRLSQYDVDRANALLQIEVKRLALENTRNNKSKLRLRRDSQGNYSYQYVANNEENDKSQKELADAQNELWNLDVNNYKNNLDEAAKIAQEATEKMAEVYADSSLTTEQQQQKIAMLTEYYENKMNAILADNISIRNNLMKDGFNEIARLYGINAEQFEAMTEQQKAAIMKNILPQMGSFTQQLVDQIAGAGGFYTAIIEPAMKMAKDAQEQRDKDLNEIEKNSGQSIGDILKGIDDTTVKQAEKLLDANDKLVDSYENQLKTIQASINAANQLVDTYRDVIETAQELVVDSYQKQFGKTLELYGTNGVEDTKARDQSVYSLERNARQTANSTSDLDNYKPYQPEKVTLTDFSKIYNSSSPTSMSTALSTAMPSAVYTASVSDFKAAIQNIASNQTLSAEEANRQISLISEKMSYIIGSNESLLNSIQKDTNIESILSEIDNKVGKNIRVNLANEIAIQNEFIRAYANKKQDRITLDQNVKIQANFPQIREIREIEQAFMELQNRAAQLACEIRARSKR